VNGVDNGLPQNTANIHIAKGTTLTVIPGQTIVAGNYTIDGGGVAIIFNGAQWYVGGTLWMIDNDADGYPLSSANLARNVSDSSPVPTGYVRRGLMYQPSVPDRDDTIPCPDYAYKPTFTVPLCKVCYHGFPDPLAKDTADSRCGSGQVCNGTGTCYAPVKRVFISSTSYTGALGGLTGADTKCQLLADSVSLGGTWKAWLSDSVTNAADRLTHGEAGYYLIDSVTKVADNWSGIVSGSLLAGINYDEKLQFVKSGTKVWTNTHGNGLKATTDLSDTCRDWTSAGSYHAVYGLNERFGGSGWTDSNYTKCSDAQRLYCFEQ